MKNIGEKMENLNGEMEDSIIDSNKNNTKIDKDTKVDKGSIPMKPEDLDGLQMLRLAQEDNKTSLKKEMVPKLEASTNHQILLEDPGSVEGVDFNHEIKCYQIAKPIVTVASQMNENNKSFEDSKLLEEKDEIGKISNSPVSKNEKYKEIEGTCMERKPALVKKEVNDLRSLTERQQKILQDFHVKFVLEGSDVEEDNDSKASRHSEFVELKKRLEEEEKMYAGCALGEASTIEQNDGDPNTATSRNLATPHVSLENKDSLNLSHNAVRSTLDGVINSFGEVAICRQDSSLQEVEKPLYQSQNVRYATKGLTDDDGLLELQEYTNREGSSGCQCCCQKAGKQIDEGEENDAYMTNSSYSVFNVVCPVSGVPVVELEDPVRSEECEHIYDRTSALTYIASMANDGFCFCASPGCRALLAENKLIADSSLWQDIEELRQIKAAMWESHMLHDFVNIDDSDDD